MNDKYRLYGQHGAVVRTLPVLTMRRCCAHVAALSSTRKLFDVRLLYVHALLFNGVTMLLRGVHAGGLDIKTASGMKMMKKVHAVQYVPCSTGRTGSTGSTQ